MSSSFSSQNQSRSSQIRNWRDPGNAIAEKPISLHQRQPRYSGEFIGIDRNAKVLDNDYMKNVRVVTDFKKVREMQKCLGRYNKGQLNFFPVMWAVSLNKARISKLETEPYIVSPKPVGTRLLVYVDAFGQTFMENMTQHIFRVDSMNLVNCDSKITTDTVLDGIMTREKTCTDGVTSYKGKLTFFIMDATRCNGIDLTDLNILQRIALVKEKIMLLPRPEISANGRMKSTVFNLDIVEPKEFHLAEDYLSEGFENSYKYQLRCLEFLPKKMGYRCGTRHEVFNWLENDKQECVFRLKFPASSVYSPVTVC